MAGLWLALVAGTAYLIGSIPFGYLVARWRGVNIFQHGSGNIGATNVGRVLGRRLGVLVFCLDFLKGALPAAGALAVGSAVDSGGSEALGPETFGVAAGLAAFLGHLFPLYLRFRGGKGVATGAGVIAVLLPGPALGAVVAWVGVVCGTRVVSLASLSAVVALLVLQLATPDPFAPGHLIMTLFCLVAAALVFLRHRGNLVRLLHGTENRIKDTPAMLTFTKTVHVLALGLWFGTLVFFTIMASSVFDTFQKLGDNPKDWPAWFRPSPAFAKTDPDISGPREQETRAAGAVVGPVFPKYFLIQGVCGFLAVATALSWSQTRPGSRVARLRVILLIVGLLTVVVGWPVEQRVEDLRKPRDELTEKFLASHGSDTAALKAEALQARKEFTLWHLASLGLSFIGLISVGIALALAAQLPSDVAPAPAPEPRKADGEQKAGDGDPPRVLTHS